MAAAANQDMPKDAIVLSLVVVGNDEIEAIPEHKRECPACQLDFEPDNLLAMVSCCDTAMHAVCFSAWLNSHNGPNKTLTKNCMKCRKDIDAARQMNSLIPPVDGKAWDEGQDFNGPKGMTTGKHIHINITPPVRHARQRRPHHAYHARSTSIPEHELPPAFRDEYRDLYARQERDRRSTVTRLANAHDAWSEALEDEGRAAEAHAAAKEAMDGGGRMTQRELDGLARQFREAKEIQVEAHEIWKMFSNDVKRMDQRHKVQVTELLQRIREARQNGGGNAQANSADAAPAAAAPPATTNPDQNATATTLDESDDDVPPATTDAGQEAAETDSEASAATTDDSDN
jgi:hypothetical protein